MNWKNVVLVVAVVAVGAIVLLSFYPTGSATDKTVSTNLTINFFGAPGVTVHEGNITTWTMVDGEWRNTSVAQPDGNTTWVFQNITAASNCYDLLVAAVAIAGAPIHAEEQSLGTFVVSVDGVANMDYQSRGWQYTVNGVYGNNACNLHAIHSGDDVVWNYQVNKFSG